MDDKIEKIEEVEKISGADGGNSSKLVPEPERVTANGEHFQALLNQDVPEKIMPARHENLTKATFMDELSALNTKVSHMKKASPVELANQARTVIAQIEDVKAKLKAPNLELKGSVQTLLNNKLSHIDESLKVALNRAGVEYTPPQIASEVTNPLEKFLGYLTHGQYQLNRLASDVELMHQNNKDISPANMLAVQIKVGFITQELEFFYNLLNSALSSTKTIMNVQV